MFDVLIREAGARFGLGDKALPVAQMLLAYMTNRDTGGLAGFLEKFKAANLGPIIQSWLGGGPSAQPISNSQVETVLGGSGGLLSLITSRLAVNRDNVTSAIGYLLPAIVGRLTPGGSVPAALPPEVTSLAAAGQSLLAAPSMAAAAAPAAGGGMMKWLPWVVVAAAALIGLSYCGKPKTTPDVGVPPAASAPAEPVAVPAPVTPASEPAPPAATASEPAAAASTEEPTGSAVVSLIDPNTMPALKVYFDSGKSDVHADFAAKAADLVAYMKANPDAKAVISGFNDPTGNAAANAELSKHRAQAVQAALVAAGVAQDHTLLEKPAETTGTSATNAASRRVEVVLRK
ncbi:YidB family protein [Ottowia testudinis]|uniref:OmpA family protein n=1 Tax=Ottowia testudinis TaxID=2816950 RepID=A0A975H494_9BURK|nr:YidB family protein [Ottowia testudinis]QTD46125.1 OmpA family protein [Ottowia testudinis]